MSRWFRLYDEMLDDPKVQRLHPALFKILINIWCVASRHDGRLPSKSDLSFALRMSEDETFRAVSKLVEAGLVDTDPTTGEQRPHGWDTRQYRSDVSTDRVRAHRDKKKVAGNQPPRGGGGHRDKQDHEGERNGDETFHVTAPEAETDTDSSEANASGTVVPLSAAAFIKAVFDGAIPLLTATGRTERESRSVIGRWRKTLGGNSHGDAELLTLISEAANKSEPLEWLMAAVETRNGNRPARLAGQPGPDPILAALQRAREAEEAERNAGTADPGTWLALSASGA